MSTNKKRFTIALSDQDIEDLEFICEVLNTQQYSKAIHVMIQVFLYHQKDTFDK